MSAPHRRKQTPSVSPAPENFFDTLRRRLDQVTLRDKSAENVPPSQLVITNGTKDHGNSKSNAHVAPNKPDHESQVTESKHEILAQLENKTRELESDRDSLLTDLTNLDKMKFDEKSEAHLKAEKESVELRAQLQMAQREIEKLNTEEDTKKSDLHKKINLCNKDVEQSRASFQQLLKEEEDLQKELDSIAKRLQQVQKSKCEEEKVVLATEQEIEVLHNKVARNTETTATARGELKKKEASIHAKMTMTKNILAAINQNVLKAKQNATKKREKLENQLSELDQALEDNKDECARVTEEIEAHERAISESEKARITTHAHVPSPKEDDGEEETEHQVILRRWPSPGARKPATPPIRRVRLINLPPDSTYHSILKLVWGGAVECLIFNPGDTWAWILFKYPDGCEAYVTDTSDGIQIPGTDHIVKVEKASRGEPIHPVLQAHYDHGATRCVHATGFPESFSATAADRLAAQRGRKVHQVEFRKDAVKAKNSVVFRFASVIDAIKFKAELHKSASYPDLKIGFVKDPCEIVSGPR